MGGTEAMLSGGIRVTDHISLSVLTASVPRDVVHAVLLETHRASERERALPAHVIVYYCIALALHAKVPTREVLRCFLEGICFLGGDVMTVVPASKAGISQARTRLGADRDDRDLRWGFRTEAVKHFVRAMLRYPCVRAHARILAR